MLVQYNVLPSEELEKIFINISRGLFKRRVAILHTPFLYYEITKGES